MTEKYLRSMVVARAEAWLGCREADGSHRPIIDLYNKYRRPGDYEMRYTDPWCAAFSSAVGMAVSVECGLPGAPYELIPSSAACDPKISQYKARGRWTENDAFVPSPGDEIFYDWEDSGSGDCTGSSDHVGIVARVSGAEILVIEGNLSDAVGYRRIPVNGRCIRGFGRPDYAAAAAQAQEGQGVIVPGGGEDIIVPATDVTDSNVGNKISLPVLRRGSVGETVRAAQLLLIGRSFGCGPWGADGEFGDATYGAVCRFQRERYLEVDGVVGPKTWAGLLGL